jgi:hypothetical protein
VNTALRAALDKTESFVSSNPWRDPDAAAVIAAKVKGLMVGYDARWNGAEWALVGDAEHVVRLPIVNPETGRTSRTFDQAGKFDGIAAGYGKTVLLEHKSTSDDIADPDAPYWRRLAIDSQVSKYMLQSWQEGLKLDGCLYDVIRKPGIRPKRLTKADLAEISAKGTYCGFQVEYGEYELVLRGQGDETPYLYFLRLSAETMAEPERYFQRRMVPRLDSEVAEYATELWQIADEIRMARINRRHFRNSEACIAYGRPCEFLGICSGHDTPDSDKWTRATEVHGELPGIGDGRDTLTNSRIKTFQTCRRKHELRYEIGLRRVNEDEAEALYLGTALHEALAAWWTAHNEGETNDGPRNDSPASEAGEPVGAPAVPDRDGQDYGIEAL